MFKNRYWREYPLFLQVVLLLLMMFSFTSFFAAITSMVLPNMLNVTTAEVSNVSLSTPAPMVNIALWVQAVSEVGIFLLPALLFAYLTHPSPTKYLGLRKPGKSIQWLLVPMVMLGAIPILIQIGALFQNMDFGTTLNDMQEKRSNTIEAFLNISSFSGLVKVFTVMAILPALCEEILFRGIVMRLLHKRSQRIGLAITVSALIFAVIHLDPIGLISMFFAGLLLAAIYYLTGSLWLSILAHLLNNGLQIVLQYIGSHNKVLKAFINNNVVPWPILVIGAVLFASSFYLLWKNRTPLPDNWSDDFAGEEREDNFTQA